MADPTQQARIVAESVDLRNPDWRADLRADVEGALRGTELVALPADHPAAVPADAPGDRDHTPTLARATTPGDDRGRELADLARRVTGLLGNLDSADAHEDAEAIAARLRALATPAETEAGAMDAGWGEHGCPECGQQIEHVRAEHTRMEWEDGARWPQPCPGSFVQVAATPPAPAGEAGNSAVDVIDHYDRRWTETWPDHWHIVGGQYIDDCRLGRCQGRGYHRDDLGESVREVPRTPAPAGPQAEGAGETASGCPSCGHGREHHHKVRCEHPDCEGCDGWANRFAAPSGAGDEAASGGGS